ncbi:hypothetical protein [Burkholderia cepacia]|uniref:hypothetical protein n=1 Tax=Burkholderia cepacia TaxID=292 RepID=UPI001CF43315|nr:hypothetical protein [Burkholderia cepacia]MCA8323265.1 hypothetical protein [Burkholderia cepacia]
MKHHTNDARACAHLSDETVAAVAVAAAGIARRERLAGRQLSIEDFAENCIRATVHALNGMGACKGHGDWKPIETAPLDGTPMLLFARARLATASSIVIGWWLRDFGWIECAFTPNRPVGLVPSHWMPLPTFPEGAC